MDQLVTSETIDGGKLRETATKKDEQRILLHILGIDCVSLEVKYHKQCYEQYTSFLRHADPKEEVKHKFNKSFESYSSWVKKEVIEYQNIFYISKLREKFIKTVMEMENEDASQYKTIRLKRRLQERFPQLVSHKPKDGKIVRLSFRKMSIKELLQKGH